MNVFVLSECPVESAQFQCDKHIPKMFLESVQLISNCLDTGPYKRTHYNHPCSKWARENENNLLWLIDHSLALSLEYTFRFNKIHKSFEALKSCVYGLFGNSFRHSNINDKRTPFAKCMPESYIKDSAVLSYRAYYMAEKSRFAQWKRGRVAPSWYRPAAQGSP